MKELTIKQKAKRYDDALEKSKRLYEQGTITESLCYVFPELKESDGEMIRKAIIGHIKGLHFDAYYGVTPDEMIAWLEKQSPKPKWSEEDEHHWMMCLECVEECATQEREDFSKTIDWLKSIKKRIEE